MKSSILCKVGICRLAGMLPFFVMENLFLLYPWTECVENVLALLSDAWLFFLQLYIFMLSKLIYKCN